MTGENPKCTAKDQNPTKPVLRNKCSEYQHTGNRKGKSTFKAHIMGTEKSNSGMTTSCSEATVNKKLIHKHKKFHSTFFFFFNKTVVWNPAEGSLQSQKIKFIEVPSVFLLS